MRIMEHEMIIVLTQIALDTEQIFRRIQPRMCLNGFKMMKMSDATKAPSTAVPKVCLFSVEHPLKIIDFFI